MGSGRGRSAALLLLMAAAVARSSQAYEDDVDKEIDLIDSPEASPGRYILGKVVDAMVPVDGMGGNDLWSGLIGECSRGASLSCVKRSVFGYLDRSMTAAGDVRLADGLVFTRNAALENKYAESLNSNTSVVEEQEEHEVEEDGRSLDSFEGVTDALYRKSVRFAMTHDVQLQLPETLFGGAVLRISPRALEQDGGALLKVEINPARKHTEEGRIFFKKHKEWKKKLLMSFMALLLVIKMIKVKLMYLLPLLIGVGAAKKLLLKVLLFIFPALAHLFKFCSTYKAHYGGKFHHHHHQIAHHHHHVKVPVPVPVPVPSHGDTVEGYPPSGQAGWDSSWDGGDYAGSRSELMAAAQQTEKELASWGLGHTAGDPGNTFSANYGDPAAAHALAYGSYAPVSASGDVRPARNTATRPSAPVYVTPGPPQRKAYPGVRPQQQALTARPPSGPGTTVAVTYDPFYSPILQKMDSVFAQLGFNEEACRERLVCSMYKSPARFSPHSNLISAELSRDPSELQKPSRPNSAVVRFYRYVQAARDGQDQKNCLGLYPACTVNTDLWRQ